MLDAEPAGDGCRGGAVPAGDEEAQEDGQHDEAARVDRCDGARCEGEAEAEEGAEVVEQV